MLTDPSTEFKKYPVEISKTGAATEAYVAVWANRGRGHVIIGAPTLAALESRWEQITNTDFDPTLAHHVFVCRTAIATPVVDAPSPRFAPDWS
jgi:hypothetical protein